MEAPLPLDDAVLETVREVEGDVLAAISAPSTIKTHPYIRGPSSRKRPESVG